MHFGARIGAGAAHWKHKPLPGQHVHPAPGPRVEAAPQFAPLAHARARGRHSAIWIVILLSIGLPLGQVVAGGVSTATVWPPDSRMATRHRRGGLGVLPLPSLDHRRNRSCRGGLRCLDSFGPEAPLYSRATPPGLTLAATLQPPNRKAREEPPASARGALGET